MTDLTEDQRRPTEPKPQTQIVFQTQSSRVTVGERGPFVPYPAVDRGDGSANHGYRHLKGRPELIELIPEVDGWPELAAVLRLCNGDGPYITIGCEKRFVLLGDDERGRPDGPVGYLNSYVDLAFAEIERNTPEELLGLAKGLATNIGDMTAS